MAEVTKSNLSTQSLRAKIVGFLSSRRVLLELGRWVPDKYSLTKFPTICSPCLHNFRPGEFLDIPSTRDEQFLFRNLHEDNRSYVHNPLELYYGHVIRTQMRHPIICTTNQNIVPVFPVWLCCLKFCQRTHMIQPQP
jgi:hypothetical protein